ncbi:ATP/GTP-binding protein [Peptostreptococcaceae bacterium AGR-M142]
MFIRFTVENFLSFEKMQEFSMIVGKTRSKNSHVYNDGKLKLLKFSAIYGANASGKSNLVSAIGFARNTILDKLPKLHTNKYNKCDIENKNKKTYFDFEIKIDNKYYSYGYEVILNESRIISEWLIELFPSNKENLIFSRNIEEGTFDFNNYFKNKSTMERLKIYAEDIKDDSSILLLHLMNQNKDNFYKDNSEAIILKKMFDWFKYKLDINYPDRAISDYSYFMTKDNIDEIIKAISSFKTGITNFNIVNITPENISIPKKVLDDIISKLEDNKTSQDIKNGNERSILLRNSNKEFIIFEMKDSKIEIKTVQFNHGNDDIFFNLSEESNGTIRILDLIEILLDNTEEKMYIIDEIDRCLHPQLTFRFVEIFLKLAEKRNIQLLVTSHESRLLDFNLLRRDEIWFIEKNEKGSSKIYSLEEYNTRFDNKVDKAYLEGRYGGIPLFNNLFSN